MVHRPLNFLALLRIFFAAVLISVSLWALFLPPLFPHSSHAIVNAKLVTIKAGDQGQVTDLPPLGPGVLAKGDRIGSVTRDLVKIQRELETSRFDQSKLQQQLESLDQLLASRENTLTEAQAGALIARETAVKSAERRIGVIRERVRISRDAVEERKSVESRVEPLLKDGIITAGQWSETRQLTIDAEKSLTVAEMELAMAEASLQQLGSGAKADGNEGAETLTARTDALEQEVLKLRIQRIDLHSELEAAAKRIAAAEAHRDTDRVYDLTTPIEGIVWRRHVVDGENLSEGQGVVDVADAQAVFVEAFFQRNFMNSIAVGDMAIVQLSPGPKLVRGRVVDIQIQESIPKGPNLINTRSLDGWMLRVVIQPEDGQLQGKNIGQMARVLVSKDNPGLFKQGMAWLTLALHSHK